MEPLAETAIRQAVQAALAEDVGSGDVTTLSTVPEDAQAEAHLVARQKLVLAGIGFAVQAFREQNSALDIEVLAQDSDTLEPAALVLKIRGSARSLLTAERVALNFVQRLSGVATMTARFVAAVEGTRARILDTRKTTPGWRQFEKYAVRCGGGLNHRFGLFDMVLIKDNHLAALAGAAPNPIAAAIQRARQYAPRLKVEVEADNLDQVRQAVAAGADFVLLDNMNNEQLAQAVGVARGKALTEASGGVNLNTIRGIAETGVDFISVGALTHSAPAADLALDFQ